MHKALIAAAAAATCLAVASTPASASQVREGGIFRVAFAGLDYVDPALSYTQARWSILDATCARLLRYPKKPFWGIICLSCFRISRTQIR